MVSGDKALGRLPKPRVIGRSIRIVSGAALLYFFTNGLLQVLAVPHGFAATRVGWRVPGGDWWVAALACVLALPKLVNTGFGVRWGQWPRIIFLLSAGVAVAWDWTVYGGFWAAPLAWLVLLLVFYILGHAGISFLVAGVAGTPG
jgi:hypothetical protein